MTEIHGQKTSRVKLRSSRVALAAAIALAALSQAPAARAQTAEEKAAARDLATRGITALSEQKYAEALDLVSRAEQILHAPTHLLLIAQAQAGLGRLVEAKETYLKLSREELPASAPAAFKRAQDSAKEELAAIEPKIASLRIDLEGAEGKKVTVKLDDQPVLPALIGVYRPIDPGKHEVVAYPMGQSPVKGAVALGEGEKKEIKLSIPAGPLPTGVPGNAADNPDALGAKNGGADKSSSGTGFFTPLRGAGLGLGVLGIGGVVVGSIFMAQSGSTSSEADELFTSCGLPCKPQIDQLDNDAAGQKTIGVIGLVGGGVALAAGVTLFVLGKPKPKAATAHMTPFFTGNAVGLRGAF